MTAHKLLYLFTCGPYSCASGNEGLDAVLAGSALEQDLSLLFIHDGVFQLLAGQDTADSELKQFTRTFRALEDFGVQRLYVHDQSMCSRGLTVEQLSVQVSELDSAGVASLIQQQYRVFTF